jgi:dnd system-associated protein 4
MTDEPKYEVTEAGRDIHIQDDKHSKYTEMIKDTTSPFHETEYTQLFMFAMVYGWQNAGRIELSGGTRALFNRSSLSDQQEWIIKSIAVKEDRDADVLKDEKRVYKIAQEYANGGIDVLHSTYVNPEDTFSEISTEIIQRSGISPQEVIEGD